MGRTFVETLMGAVVLAVAGVFLVYAYTRANVQTVAGYQVTALFTTIDGLKVGDDVRISGIKVGSVVDQTLDPEFFQAVVTLSIEPWVSLPEDTSVAVASEGLFGGKYLALEPGGSEEIIEPGGRISFTQSSVNLESLLGKVIYNVGQGSAGESE